MPWSINLNIGVDRLSWSILLEDGKPKGDGGKLGAGAPRHQAGNSVTVSNVMGLLWQRLPRLQSSLEGVEGLSLLMNASQPFLFY
jgi:hypothetical protein